MVKNPSGPKDPSLFQIFKNELPAVREMTKSAPLYQRLLLPVAIAGGIVFESFGIAKQSRAEKQFIADIKAKYDIEEVKLNAKGCTTSVMTSLSQSTVMQVNGVDYVFLLEFDEHTREPVLSRWPFDTDSMPYHACPIDPTDLLRETSSS